LWNRADTSYSWSANILGRKRWHLIRPSEVQYCRQDPSNPRSPLLSDIRAVSSSLYPHFHTHVHPIVIEQEVHDVLFVPSNWYHYVENISPYVISINHNWCNSYNLQAVYEAMWTEVDDTMYEMRDVKELIWSKRRKDLEDEESRMNEWMSTVQDVVRMNAGWECVLSSFTRDASVCMQYPECDISVQLVYLLEDGCVQCLLSACKHASIHPVLGSNSLLTTKLPALFVPIHSSHLILSHHARSVLDLRWSSKL